MKIMFWNIGSTRDEQMIVELISSCEPDIVFLAECDVLKANDITFSLNKVSSPPFYGLFPQGISSIMLITRYSFGLFSPVYDDARYTIRALTPPATNGLINLVAVHLPSKLSAGQGRQYYFARQLRRQIEETELRMRSCNTILIGDFNLNPFEEAMTALDGLNAVMDQSLVERANRTMFDQNWSSFYNPMWSLLGDKTKGPSGTHFYVSGEPSCYFWNMFDQVILRPSLLTYFDFDQLVVYDSVGSRSLMKNGKLDRSIVDHLPISVTLHVEGKM